jgi:hypothetical protein
MANDIALRAGSDVALRPRYSPSRRAQRETVTFRNAQIIFRNFTGKAGPYNEEGERSFAVLLDEDLAKQLHDRGMNIKPIKKREGDEDDEQMYYLPVAVSYRIRPPRVYMVTGDGDVMPLRKTLLTEDLLSMMDNLELAEAHMVVAISNYDVRGTKGKKAYLQSFFGHVLMDELEQEYATVEDMIHVDTEEHREDDNVIEGEIAY